MVCSFIPLSLKNLFCSVNELGHYHFQPLSDATLLQTSAGVQVDAFQNVGLCSYLRAYKRPVPKQPRDLLWRQFPSTEWKMGLCGGSSVALSQQRVILTSSHHQISKNKNWMDTLETWCLACFCWDKHKIISIMKFTFLILILCPRIIEWFKEFDECQTPWMPL